MKTSIGLIQALWLSLLASAVLASGPPPAELEGEGCREQPVIVVSPHEIELTLPPGAQWQSFLGIGNEGDPGSLLQYSVSAAPTADGDRSIAGSTLSVSPDGYLPGEPMFFYFTAYNASEDYEWLDEITTSFPPGVRVLGSTDFEGGTFGPLVTDHTVGENVTITWFDDNGGYGNIWGGESAVARVMLVMPADVGDVTLGFTMSGDVFGDTPHDIAGKVVIAGPGGTSWLDLPITEGELAAGETEQLPLLFSTDGLEEGLYEASLVISSNAGPDIFVPVRLIVSQATASAAPPAGFSLAPNYPNPFNPSTTITFSLPAPGVARLEVLDLSGRRLRVLASGHLPAGRRSVVWDGRDEAGRALPSGIYLCRLQAAGGSFTRKMLLAK